MTNSVIVKHVQCRNVVCKLELVDDYDLKIVNMFMSTPKDII